MHALRPGWEPTRDLRAVSSICFNPKPRLPARNWAINTYHVNRFRSYASILFLFNRSTERANENRDRDPSRSEPSLALTATPRSPLNSQRDVDGTCVAAPRAVRAPTTSFRPLAGCGGK